MNTLTAPSNENTQLDNSLTSMEWLNRLPTNKGNVSSTSSSTLMVTATATTHGGNHRLPSADRPYHVTVPAKDLSNMTITKIPPIISAESTAQRAEPNRPVDLNAEYKGGGEHNRRDGKPPYSYVNLITFAINSTPKKRMTLNEIYQWISDNFHYYQRVGNGWKVI